MIIKNSNLRGTLFENRYKILGVIIAIILVLLVIQILNGMAKQNMTSSSSKNQNLVSSYQPQETIIIGENVPEKQQEINTNVIENFIKYCNEKQIEKAYNLLTEECRQKVFYSKIENFQKNYVDVLFPTPKIYSMQSWIKETNSTTYKVQISDDMLATGKAGNSVEDYITIVRKGEIYQLNVKNYIGRKEIGKVKEENNIQLTIVHKDIYMDYETYFIKIQNNTNQEILLDSKENTKSAYITGNNETMYRAFLYEIDNSFLSIKPHIYTTINVRFNKVYNPNIQTKKITFSDIILNKEEYETIQDKTNYKKRTKIEVEL